MICNDFRRGSCGNNDAVRTEVQRYSVSSAPFEGPTPTLSRDTPAKRWVTNVAGLSEDAGVR